MTDTMENTGNQTQANARYAASDRVQGRTQADRQQSEPQQIDLIEVASVLLHRWKLLLLGIIVGGLIAGGWVYMQPAEYQSTAMVYSVTDTSSSTVSSLLNELQIGSSVSEDYAIISSSKAVLDTTIEQVEDEVGVTLTRTEIQESLSVTNEEDTHVLVFTVTTEDPDLSSAIANAITEATVNMMANVINADPPVIFETAEPEYTPIDDGLTSTAAKGAVVGFVIAALLILIPYLLNDKISTKQDVEKYLGYGVLGVIPLEKGLEYKKK